MQIFAPGDLVCRCGDLAKELFLVKRGRLEVLDEEGGRGVVVGELPEDSSFGELSLLRMGPLGQCARRSQSLRSVGYSDVYILRQDDVSKRVGFSSDRFLNLHHLIFNTFIIIFLVYFLTIFCG
jgi:CRP-like cAMP-binding protein